MRVVTSRIERSRLDNRPVKQVKIAAALVNDFVGR